MAFSYKNLKIKCLLLGSRESSTCGHINGNSNSGLFLIYFRSTIALYVYKKNLLVTIIKMATRPQKKGLYILIVNYYAYEL